MNLNELFRLQNTLDERITKEHNLSEPLLSKKILALQVELGELANETKCFKFWSKKPPCNKNIILEEYVDCLHFILSIGIEKNFIDINLNSYHTDSPLTDQFHNLFIDVNDFIVCNSKDHYITLFEDFLTLGFSLNFSNDDIKKGYLRKNSINHKRQDEGY
ncbi:dUTP diphosphatase [Haloimpatiens sp. FM7330]|uniref:dUTP diphosphatase n=1 Tax=Haloimpatiens sp. FM7330 TaxID=3298610 RepID=UPI00362FBD54